MVTTLIKADESAKNKGTSRSLTESDGNGKDALVLQSDLGTTHVSEDVVAKIAGLAVREVKGVHALVPYGASQALTNLAKTIAGGEAARDLGINVEVGKIEAAVDVRIVTVYGESIPRISDEIRSNLGRRIREMTGLELKEVNIDVLDLYFEEDDAAAEARAEARARKPTTRVR